MPAFTDNFASLGGWTEQTSGTVDAGAGQLTIDGAPPAAAPGAGGSAGLIEEKNAGTNKGRFAWSRLDLVDGGDNTRTDWIVYAFYINDWAELWANPNAYFTLPGHAVHNDPNTQLNWGYNCILDATSASTGELWTMWQGPFSLADKTWHTIRYGVRIDGASTTEELWLDGVQVLASTNAPGESLATGSFGPNVFDDFRGGGGTGGYTSAKVWIDAMTWSPGVDPGEPAAAPPFSNDPVVCGEGLSVRVFIDGAEVTDFAVEGAWSPRLNRPAQAHVKVPMDRDEGGTTPIGDCGSLLKIVLTDGGTSEEIVFHGPVLNVEVDTEKDGGYTVYNAQDHMELWQWRIVRADDGDFSKPVGSLKAGQDLILDYDNAPAIMEAILKNSEGNSTAQGNPALTPPVVAEGPLFLTIGTVTGGSASMAGAPVDWPQTIQEFFATLVSTGQLDAYIEYTDPGGGITGTIHLLPGNLGTDRSASVGLYYGVAPRNAAAVRWNRDMTNAVNKYQIFAGPRVETAADPAGEQHWCFNITGDDPGLARPPGGDVNAPYSGGIAPGSAGNELGGRRLDSQAAYGVRMRVDVIDAYDGDCIRGFGTPGRDLLRYQWQVFSWFAAMPREIIHMDALPDTLINCFHVGDLIHVEASSEVRGGFSGKQRVYGYTVSWEGTPSVLTLSEIQTSADAEGASG